MGIDREQHLPFRLNKGYTLLSLSKPSLLVFFKQARGPGDQIKIPMELLSSRGSTGYIIDRVERRAISIYKSIEIDL
jgi:hypothetical protein